MSFNAGDLVATIRVDGMNAFQSNMRSAQSTATATQKVFRSATDAGGKALTALSVTAIATATAAARAYSDWASTMAQVQSLSRANATDMKKLSDQTMQFAGQFGITASQAAEAELELVKGGVSVTDMVNGGLKGALTLAAAGQLNVGDATSIAVSAMTQFGLKGQDVSHIADLLAAGADKALGSVQDLGEGLKYVGPVASGLGISLEQTVGTLAELAQNGIIGEQAGTSLRGMLSSLTSPSKLAADTMHDLGIKVYDAQGKFIGLNGVAQQLQDKTKKLTEAQKNQALGQIFGNQQITAAQVLLKGGAAAVDQWTTAVDEQGFAAEQAAGKLDSLSGDVQKFSASLKNDLVQAGSVTSPLLRQLVQSGTELLNTLGNVESKGVAPVASILATRLNPAFATFTDLLDKADVVISTWDSSQLEEFFDKAGQYAPELSALGGAAVAMTTGFAKSIPVLGALVPAVNPALAAIIALAAASPEVRASVGDLGGALKPLIPIGEQLAQILATSLNSALPITANLIEGVVDVATPLVRILASIPAPVLLGVGAFLALRRALSPLSADGAVVSRVISNVGDSISATRGIVAESGGAISTFRVGLGLAGTAAVGLGNSLKAAFLSNPIGLALTAISIGVGLVASALAKGQQEAADYNNTVAELKGTLDSSSGAITDQTRATIANSLATDKGAKSGKTYTDLLQKQGIAANSFTEAITGSSTAYGVMQDQLLKSANAHLQNTDAMNKATTAAVVLGVSTDTVVDAAIGNAAAQKQLNAAYKRVGDTTGVTAQILESARNAIRDQVPDVVDLTTELNNQRKATQDAIKQEKAFADAVSAAADKMTDAERSNSRLNDAIAIARDTSKDATTRLNALKDAIDELSGGSQSAAERQADLAQSSLNLKDAFNATDDSGHKLINTLVDQNGKIDLSTQAGINLSNQVSDLRDKMLSAMQAASDNAVATGHASDAYKDAVAAAAPYSAALAEAGKQAGLSDTQIANMTATMLGIPAVQAYLITNNGSVDANTQQVLSLIQNIESTPDGHFTVSESSIDPIKDKLSDLGIKITTLPGGKVELSIPNLGTIQGQLAALSAPVTKKITVEAVTGSGGGGGGGVANLRQANGGVLAFFAGGGFARTRPLEQHVAQIAPAGAWRVWAEPETGGEAYIPLSPAKRERSTAIWRETGKRLGVEGAQYFANGGVSDSLMWQFLSGDTSAASLISALQQASTDDLFIKQAQKDLAAEAQRDTKALASLNKSLDSAQTALDKASNAASKAGDNLQSLKDSAAQLKSSVASSLTSGIGNGLAGSINIGGWGATVVSSAKSILGYLTGNASKLKTFATLLGQLKAKGVPASLIEQIADLGADDGTAVAQALLSASAADLASIGSAYNSVQSYANQAGQVVSDSVYAQQITIAQKTYDQAVAAQTAAQKRVDSINQSITNLGTTIRQVLTRYYGVKAEDGALVHRFADGGVPRVPQIAQGGRNILWAEPETGWEAYISGKPGMRPRNLAILDEAARRLGVKVVNPSTTRALAGGGTAGVSDIGADRQVNVELQFINPVVRDLMADTRQAAQIVRTNLNV
ncbi:phage tail tape measure protein [Gryllotalpicola koreensis]|uniref:Phage tail tape measure protein domain-containing protein n=1 Tax=Gryllotalpicola koreensis TaxID=993086 RepID=A0ABP8A2X7_9MICO